MKTLTQTNETPARHHDLSRTDAGAASPVVRLADRNRNAQADLERARQINRIDALKVLIRSLLDQVDCLTVPVESDETADVSLQAMVRRFETELIRHALIRTGGKQRQAARLLGEKKTTLNAKILRYGIKIEGEDPPSPQTANSVTDIRTRHQVGT